MDGQLLREMVRKARDVAVTPPDAELLDRFVRAADAPAFGELVRRHSGLVRGVCRRLLQNAQDVEDASQATFLVLARSAGSIRKRDSLGCWLHDVAFRVAPQLCRRRDRPCQGRLTV